MNSWQRAFILHSRPYRETSLLLEVFTEHFGRLTLLAKGVRAKRSQIKGYLQLFTPLLIRWGGRGELKTLRQVEAISLSLPITGTMLYSALYLNEILIRILEPETIYSSLFFSYMHSLQQLAATSHNSEPILRCFELELLHEMGYGIDFLHCMGTGEEVVDSMNYRYRQSQGFLGSMIKDHLSFSGRELKALASRNFTDENLLKAAKRFTRIALKPYLGAAPLKSRELFSMPSI